jgi:hypothetical protein
MKITGALHSDIAQGTVASILTFSKRKSGQVGRYQRKQKYTNSNAQNVVTSRFTSASLSCRTIGLGYYICGLFVCGGSVDSYDESARLKDVSGYNLCISEFIKTYA